MTKNTLKYTVLFLILSFSFSFAQDNIFARAGRNFAAYFNTFYNAKVYFEEAQALYEEQEDKDKLDSKTRAALNKASRQAELVMDRFPKSDYVDDCMYFSSICKYQLKRYDRTLEMLEELTLRFPDSPYYFEAKLWIAKSYYETDRQAIAYDLLERFLDNRKNRAYFGDAYELIGYLALQEGDKEKALTSFVEAAANSNRKEAACNMYLEAAELYLDKADYDNALRMVDLAMRNVRFDEQRARSFLAYVEIYRMQGQFDKASGYITEGLKDARIASYWGDLKYELANLNFQQDNLSQGLKQLMIIVEDEENEYKNNKVSNAWAKAALKLGDYYIYDHFEEDSAELFLKKAQTKRRRCEEGVIAEKRYGILNDLKKVNKELKKLEKNEPAFTGMTYDHYIALRDSAENEIVKREAVLKDTLNAEQTKKDSLKRAAMVNFGQYAGDYEEFMEEAEEYAQNLINAAGIFLFEFEIPDTAFAIYRRISRDLAFVPSAAQALYSQGYVYRYEYDQPEKADSLEKYLFENYPHADITLAVSGIVPEDSLRYYEIEDRIYHIEMLMEKNGVRAGLDKLKELLKKEDLDQGHAGHIAYKIAWLYDNELSQSAVTVDSTLEYYRYVSENFPEHPLNQASALRIAAIEADIEDYQAYLRGDSLSAGSPDTVTGDFTDETSSDTDERGPHDTRRQHPLMMRLKSPARPRPVRL